MTELIAFLDAHEIGSAALVGASFGGWVALQLATTHPDRVSRLVLLCPSLRGTAPTDASEAFEVQIEADAWPDPPTMVHEEVDLAGIGVPTAVVLGAHDADWLQAATRQVAETVPGADLVELGWAGHLPSLERPKATATLVRELLGEPTS